MPLEQTRLRHASIDELLGEVFRTAATAGRQRSVLLAAMMGRIRGGAEYSSLEIATEAVALRGAAIRAAGHMGARAVVAMYEYPVDDSTQRSEDLAIEICAHECLSHNERLRDQYFVRDCIRLWAGKRMHHDFDWWGKHLDRSPRTLEFRWCRRSGETGDMSVHAQMIRLLGRAHASIEAMLDERGVEWRHVA